jgi:hypothetical protein
MSKSGKTRLGAKRTAIIKRDRARRDSKLAKTLKALPTRPLPPLSGETSPPTRGDGG